jgi:hypothetical protein
LETYEKNGHWYMRATKEETRAHKKAQERQGMRLVRENDSHGNVIEYWLREEHVMGQNVVPKEPIL